MTQQQHISPQDLFRLFAENEPEDLRSHLFVARDNQQLILGSTVPPIQEAFQRRDSGGIWVPDSATEPSVLDMFQIYLTLSEYAFPPALADFYEPTSIVDALSHQGPFRQRITNLALLGSAASDESILSDLAGEYGSYLTPDVEERYRNVMRAGQRIPRRRFLSRQGVFVAMREVFSRLDGDGEEVGATIGRAIALIHAVGDTLYSGSTGREEGTTGGLSTDLAMEIMQNELFHRADDDLLLLYRYYLLWTDYGDRLARTALRSNPSELIEEATGLSILDWIAFGFAIVAQRRSRQGNDSAWFGADYFAQAEPNLVSAFLSRASRSPEDFAEVFSAIESSWNFLPIQETPLLFNDDSYLLLDESFMLDRVTRGIYWDVHDHEAITHGDNARLLWTQAHGEMIEAYVVDTVRSMSPQLLGSGKTLFTEEDLKAAYPGKVCDVAIDFGVVICLIEVVGGRVKTGTRLEGDRDDFLSDTERLVLKKARQLSEIGAAILDNETPLTGLDGVAGRTAIPVLVGLGVYPVNPASIQLIEGLLQDENLFAYTRTAPLCIIDLGELEMLYAWSSDGGPIMSECLSAWKNSPLARVSLRNWAFYSQEVAGLKWRSPRLLEGSRDLFDRLPERLGLLEDQAD